MTELLKKLMFTSGVSGREDKIRAVIESEVKPYADEITTDNMGNLIVRKKGNGKKIMFCAHMDEIGFFVTSISGDGMINVSPVGGINFLSATYTEVISERGVHGALITGVKGEIPKGEDAQIDIGARDKKHAEKHVSVGDFFVVKPSFRKLLNSKCIGRPFDDRVGCAIMIEALKQIKTTENDLYFVFCVQEEVGGRGSKPAAYGIAPDIAIALDVTLTGDKPGSPNMVTSLGGGCAIKIKESQSICHIGLVKQMKEIASQGGIKHQDEVLVSGGSDTAQIQVAGRGAKASAISIPCAYIHSSVEMIDLNDVKKAVKLTVALCRGL